MVLVFYRGGHLLKRGEQWHNQAHEVTWVRSRRC